MEGGAESAPPPPPPVVRSPKKPSLNRVKVVDKDNYAYCQSSVAHNVNRNLWRLALRGNLYTDAQALFGMLLGR